jgi:hypothetical protein
MFWKDEVCGTLTTQQHIPPAFAEGIQDMLTGSNTAQSKKGHPLLHPHFFHTGLLS